MTATSDEALAFSAARLQSARGAKQRWLRQQPSGSEARWSTLPILLDPLVRTLSSRVLAAAVSSFIVEVSTPFPSMVWYGGAMDTYGGHRFRGTVGDFVEHVLRARAQEVAAKRCGWVVTPTTNTDGHRVNASTKAMHALNLDCDSTGTWDVLLATLTRLDLTYIAYQSGGFAPSAPKWHLLLPLVRPFDASTPERQTLWRQAYAAARVVLGSVGGLLAEGFDSACDTPCQPVFVTERRSEVDPPREVVWHPGLALDLDVLVDALPVPASDLLSKEWLPVEEDVPPFDDERFDALVLALSRETSNVPADRRALYLALPGALLERSVEADDVLSIIESVSASYPRPDAEAHRDNLHCAKTTISRWESGLPVTQIGTLADLFPGVARVLDEAFPEYAAARLAEAQAEVDVFLTRLGARKGDVEVPLFAPLSTAPPKRTVQIRDLRAPLVALRRWKRRPSASLDERLQAEVLGAFLLGDDIALYVEDEEGGRKPVVRPDGRSIGPNEAIFMVAGMVAAKVPVSTSFEEVREIFRPSLHAMCAEGEKPDVLFRKAERAFLKAMRSRLSRTEERHAREVRDRLDRLF